MRRTIGIDVSQDFLDVAVFDGMKTHTRHYDTHDSKAFQQIMKDYRITSNTLVVMEATGVYHLKLANFFLQKGCKVSVVNPLKVKRYGQMKFRRAKTDKADAQLIAHYGYEQQPALYQPIPKEREELMLLLKGIADLNEMKTQMLNRLHSLKKRVIAPQILIDSLQNQVQLISQDIKALKNECQRLAQTFAEKDYQRLQEIPGIGPNAALAILGYFGQFETFESANQVIAYAGLNPHPRVSGSSVRGSGSISKKGHAYLRKIFYMAALSAARCNPKCQELYERLIVKGKAKNVALIAVANKLLRQCFAIMKHQRQFDPNFSEKRYEAT